MQNTAWLFCLPQHGPAAARSPCLPQQQSGTAQEMQDRLLSTALPELDFLTLPSKVHNGAGPKGSLGRPASPEATRAVRACAPRMLGSITGPQFLTHAPRACKLRDVPLSLLQAASSPPVLTSSACTQPLASAANSHSSAEPGLPPSGLCQWAKVMATSQASLTRSLAACTGRRLNVSEGMLPWQTSSW